MIEPERIKEGLYDYEPYARDLPCLTIKSGLFLDALEYIETLEERIAIMTEGKEVKYTPEKGALYDQEYWLCGNCNEPIEIGTVERKHLRNYCYLCGAKIDKGEENEDQR